MKHDTKRENAVFALLDKYVLDHIGS